MIWPDDFKIEYSMVRDKDNPDSPKFAVTYTYDEGRYRAKIERLIRERRISVITGIGPENTTVIIASAS